MGGVGEKPRATMDMMRGVAWRGRGWRSTTTRRGAGDTTGGFFTEPWSVASCRRQAAGRATGRGGKEGRSGWSLTLCSPGRPPAFSRGNRLADPMTGSTGRTRPAGAMWRL